ncbi:MAG TPA: sensor histidine kinase [Caproicibacter sp.]|nr:sensor histidine kinase [Caproicibacter sp.]
MKLWDFLKDRWISLTAVVLISAFSATLLIVLGAGVYAACYVAILFVLGEIAALAAEFFQRRSFYAKLMDSLEHLDKKQLIVEMLPEPSFTEAKILCNVVSQAGKCMNDEIAKYRIETKEYREYVETWMHEIKTPISACRLILENNPGKLSHDLGQDFDRIENYVDQALFYARSGSLEKDYVLKKCTLHQLASNTVKKHAALLIESGVKVETENLNIPVYADAKWLEFIIGQIIINSVKYRKNDPVISFSGIQGQDNATLVIEDNGIGIPQKDLGRVFEKGFTGENGRMIARSTGLGLYLCKRLCDKMGLGISIVSIEGSGTAVSILFPVSGMYSVIGREKKEELTKS